MSDATNKVYGYARISRAQQNIERQIRNISQHNPKAIIIQEVYSAKNFQDRKALVKLCNRVVEGDTIIFDSVSRMSRNAEEGFETYRELFDKGVNLVFLKEPHINTETYKTALENKIEVNVNTGDNDTDNFMTDMFNAINKYIHSLQEKQIKLAFEQSEKELEDLRQRTKEGIETARINGKQIGRTKGKKYITKKSISAKEKIVKHNKSFGGTLNDTDTMKLAGISRMSFYKYKKEIIDELRDA